MFSVSLIIHTQITSSVYYQLFCAAKLGDYPLGAIAIHPWTTCLMGAPLQLFQFRLRRPSCCPNLKKLRMRTYLPSVTTIPSHHHPWALGWADIPTFSDVPTAMPLSIRWFTFSAAPHIPQIWHKPPWGGLGDIWLLWAAPLQFQVLGNWFNSWHVSSSLPICPHWK